MTNKEFLRKQAKMTDAEIIAICEKQILKLCETGGRSFRMSVPPETDDVDMVFSQLIHRFRELKEETRELQSNGICSLRRYGINYDESGRFFFVHYPADISTRHYRAIDKVLKRLNEGKK